MKKILVIEDEERTRNLFLNCLKTEGFCIISAENGLVGVQQAQEQLPDLVICDVMMPELDGYDVVTTLRQNPVTASIPFIFLTARETRAEIRKGMDLGADDYLIKPCKIEEILRAIFARLEKQKVLRQCYATEYQQVKESQPIQNGFLPDFQSNFPGSSQLKKVFEFIEDNYHQPINVRDVALTIGYSPAYLTNLVKRQTKQTIHCWIVKRRMAEACSLLLETDLLVNQIGARVGYVDPGHFIRQFRKVYNMPPKVWRDKHRCIQSWS